jgi:hypothetical protein
MIERRAMRKKVNLAEKLAGFGERFSPKIVDQLNDYKIEVVIPFPRLKHSRPASAHSRIGRREVYSITSRPLLSLA